jgi:Arc/MetJ family transcription regulator
MIRGGSVLDVVPKLVLPCRIYCALLVYTRRMGKHLVDIDEKALSAARAEMGTVTIKETVNRALRLAVSARDARVASALDVLADAEYQERSQAWR